MPLGCNKGVYRGAWSFKASGITLGNCVSLKEQRMVLSYPSCLLGKFSEGELSSPEMYSCTVIV